MLFTSDYDDDDDVSSVCTGNTHRKHEMDAKLRNKIDKLLAGLKIDYYHYRRAITTMRDIAGEDKIRQGGIFSSISE